jgi:iron complex outermembrane receptor protein
MQLGKSAVIRPTRYLACWLGALLLPGTLIAQEGAQTSTAELEEIIVEATRLSRPLDRVPAAVSVVTQDEIQLGRQQLGLDEALTRVPGLFMQNRYNFAQDLRIAIRGFGARSSFGIRGIKILVDGIPETLPDGQGQVDSIDLGTIRQIEVIRGPSSSLYGNASGGVVSVTSERAPETPMIDARVTVGYYDYRKLQVKAGGRTERMDYFVSLSDSELDGYRAHSEAENTQFTGRFNFDLGADSTFMAVVNFTDQPISNDPGGINAAQAEADPRSARDRNVAFDAGEALEQSRLGFVYTLPLGERHEITARNYYVSRDFRNKLPFTGGGAVDLERFFAGVGVTYRYDGMWGNTPSRWIVGVDFDDQDDDRRRFDNDLGNRGALTFDQNEHVTSQGIFVQNELTLNDNLEVSFGLRYDELEFDVDDHFLSDGDDSGSLTFDDVSPMLGILVDLSPALNVYGTISTSFETPTTTELANPSGAGGFNTMLEPQTATNFEVGLRGALGERSTYELAIFQIDVDDELIPFELQSSPGRDFFSNAGESSRAGLEFALASTPMDRLNLTISYTYSDFEFDTFLDDNGNDFSGNTIPGTAENVLFGEAIYNHPSGWYGALDALYVDEQFTNNSNTATNDAYAIANLRFGFERAIGSIIISPFIGVNNLFDETYNSNVRINAFGGRYFEPGPERNAYAGVSVRFDLR